MAAQAKEKGTMTDSNTNVETTTQDTPEGAARAGTGKDTTPPAPPVKAAAVPDGAVVADQVAKIRSDAAAEFVRIAAIRKVLAKDGDDHAEICAQAIKEAGMSRTPSWRSSVPTGPRAVLYMVDSPSLTSGVLEAACMLTAGLEGVEKLHDLKRPLNSPASGSGAASACRSCCWRRRGLTATAAATSAIPARC